ncbi:hypothetical protein LGK95_05735 [Clostridium algoriphilum]|uniref:hypothetical protein n=1 Tax=Clostridium algoriphilum TaxID=198347 RepID=UPI001CF1B799|nr:hypothetical protein [Clostridium algoriphilum]MCB2293023.1 hypothetical protein [Clostridium algoriphilum]
MNIFIQILSMIVFAIIALALYYVLKTYVLYKIKISKWIVLGIAIVFFIVPMIVWPTMPTFVSKYVIPGIFVIFALWFMDLAGLMRKKKNVSKTNYTSTNSKKDKKDDIVIRPKAKPNRVKNNKK